MRYSGTGTNYDVMGISYAFNTPNNSGVAGPLDGNLASNRVTGIGSTYTPAQIITNGQKFYLRWTDQGALFASGQGMAIDDFSITFLINYPPPIAVTLPATSFSNNAATLNGGVNPQGPSTFTWFDWGATTNYGNSTPTISLSSGTTNFNQVITGLTVGVTYHFRAAVSNSLNLSYGTNQSFTAPLFTDAGLQIPFSEEPGIAWGDYDNDGRLDILLTAYDGTNPIPSLAKHREWVYQYQRGRYLQCLRCLGGLG